MGARGWLQGGILVGLGCLQMAGDILRVPPLKAFGAVSHVSPAPRVFTTQNGFETFSSTFVLSAWDERESVTTLRLSPEVNARVRGPYNRRNAYGAVISYGPVLASSSQTLPMFESALRYGLCSAGGVASDVGLGGRRFYAVDVIARGTDPNSAWPTRFEVDCESGTVEIN